MVPRNNFRDAAAAEGLKFTVATLGSDDYSFVAKDYSTILEQCLSVSLHSIYLLLPEHLEILPVASTQAEAELLPTVRIERYCSLVFIENPETKEIDECKTRFQSVFAQLT